MEVDASLTECLDYDLQLCVICQRKRRKRNRSKCDSASVISGTGLESLKEAAEKRKKKVGTDFSLAISIIDADLEKNPNSKLVWHRAICRPDFISQHKIDRLDDVVSAMEIDYEGDVQYTQHVSSMYLRSEDVPYNSATDCVICCRPDGPPLHLIGSYNVHEELKKAAKTDYKLMTRLNKAFDSIAGDILYHRDCFRILIRDSSTKCSSARVKHISHLDILDDIVRELRSKIDRGCAVLLSDCWERYVYLCQNEGARIPLRLERRRSLFSEELLARLPSIIEIIPSSNAGDFVVIPCQLPLEDKARLVEGDQEQDFNLPSYNENEIFSMVHVALKLRSDLLNHPHNTKAKMTDDNCLQCVPESVYMFLTLLFGGQELLDGFDEETPNAALRKRKVLNVGQDLLYAVTMGRNIPPKQYSMGLTLHQATRDDVLVKLFHSALQCMSYEEVLAADTGIVRDSSMISPQLIVIIP